MHVHLQLHPIVLSCIERPHSLRSSAAPRDCARIVARSDKQTRALVTWKIQEDIELIATLICGTNEKYKGGARSQAILTYCALIGAIGVARAVSDQQLSREILKTVAQLLKNPLRKTTSATSER